MTDVTATGTLLRRRAPRLAALALAATTLVAGYAGGRATVSAGTGAMTAAAPVVADRARVPGPLTSYSGVVDAVAPAVVTVRTEHDVEVSPAMWPMMGGRGVQRQRGLGSGVIVRADGFILTNNHVIDGAERIRVDASDGRSWPARLVGADPASDLAVLRVDERDLPVVPYGDSARTKVGDVVLAFGNPLGVGQTVTMGIVSAKGRATGVGDGSYEDFLQTDAAINQGNSGGALVDLDGRLVGINAQILSTSGGNIGLGFAIPSEMARAVADQLITSGVVRRSKLGIVVQPMTPELADTLGVAEARGAVVAEVEPGGPAARAGLRQGDQLIAIDGRPVIDANQVRNQIAGTRPGTGVAIEIRRNGRSETVSVTLAERQDG
ncbi:MAG: trypsin-like peptidase domain-containing protein, partial [Acidobacteria bacterium]|nr:trypsin-like peptidase domain-containing protein [Acidobacteriota bacterium]